MSVKLCKCTHVNIDHKNFLGHNSECSKCPCNKFIKTNKNNLGDVLLACLSILIISIFVFLPIFFIWVDSQIEQDVKDLEYYIPNDNELTTIGKTWEIITVLVGAWSFFVIFTQVCLLWDMLQSRKRKDWN